MQAVPCLVIAAYHARPAAVDYLRVWQGPWTTAQRPHAAMAPVHNQGTRMAAVQEPVATVKWLPQDLRPSDAEMAAVTVLVAVVRLKTAPIRQHHLHSVLCRRL